MTLVSVILPLFNKETWIDATVRSVLRQSFLDWELLIVDDGSTDRSLVRVNSLLDSLVPSDRSKIRLLQQVNKGQSHARTNGINQANGEFLAFLDADDVWHPRKLEIQFEFMKKNPKIDLVLTNYFILSERKSSIPRTVTFSPLDLKVLHWYDLTGFGGLVESTGMIKRKYYESVGGFPLDTAMGSGLELVVKSQVDRTLGLVDEVLCLYRSLADGWHTDTIDLVRTCDVLQSREFVPSSYKVALQNNIAQYLYWRELRNKSSRPYFCSILVTQYMKKNGPHRAFLKKVVRRVIKSYIDSLFNIRNIITLLRIQ